MDVFCHYSALGVDENASSQEITSAYAVALAHFRKRLSKGNPHPVERLDAIRTAYQTLISPELRQRYDDHRARRTAADPTASAHATPSAATDHAQEMRVEFKGSGGEYFRIWLVNIALTLLTLGIYSAWAKVRREKYFHHNMIVDGSALDYHGKPRAILLGRLVLLLVFILGSFAENLGSTAKSLASLLGLFIFPWLMVQSMRFRARNTSYRGIRFGFSGKYRQVLVLFLLHGGMCFLTLGLYFPVFLQKQKAFIARHLSYGNTPVEFSAGIGVFYRGLLFPLILWCLLLAGLTGVGVLTLAGDKSQAFILALLYGVPLLVSLMVFVQLILVPYARVVGTNLLWNHMRLGSTRFRSTQTVRSYLGISLSNWALTLLTVGLFWPLAQIRLASFRARNLFIVAPQALSDVAAGAPHEAPAFGSEAMAAMDLDIAL
jgi:uncharacterized membrane protein YjgN (DUF898 family)